MGQGSRMGQGFMRKKCGRRQVYVGRWGVWELKSGSMWGMPDGNLVGDLNLVRGGVGIRVDQSETLGGKQGMHCHR